MKLCVLASAFLNLMYFYYHIFIFWYLIADVIIDISIY
jgi:hypothetical protein